MLLKSAQQSVNDYQQELNTSQLHLPTSLTLGFESPNFDLLGIIPTLNIGWTRQFLVISSEFVF